MKNISLRKYATEKNVFLWEVAEADGMTDFSFSRKLRHELPKEEVMRLKGVIDSIAEKAGR